MKFLITIGMSILAFLIFFFIIIFPIYSLIALNFSLIDFIKSIFEKSNLFGRSMLLILYIFICLPIGAACGECYEEIERKNKL